MKTIPICLSAVALIALSACSSPASDPAPAAPVEVASLTPRVVLSHADGLTTINAVTGEVLSEHRERGFFRLNPAGDGRHVYVSDADGFRLYDSGNDAEAHEDHFHYYESAPRLTDVTIDAAKPGHVVTDAGATALFSDGAGTATVIPTDHVADANPPIRTIDTGAPHHGVAVPLPGDEFLHTAGTEDERTTIKHVDATGRLLSETTDCPGVHGEAVASTGAVVFGCTNGPVVYRDGSFHKLAADGYQRNGNLAGSPESPIVLGDNKVDEHAEQEHPMSVALIDTRTAKLTTVNLGHSYWFRSLGRGPHGEGLVLTDDGALTVIDPDTGSVTQRIPVIKPWQENEDWQQPGPILTVAGSDAYITDPTSQELAIVDLTTGTVSVRHHLDFAPVEMSVATGRSPATATH